MQFAIEALPGTKEASIRLNTALPGIPHTILSVGRTRSGKTTTCIQMYSNNMSVITRCASIMFSLNSYTIIP